MSKLGQLGRFAAKGLSKTTSICAGIAAGYTIAKKYNILSLLKKDYTTKSNIFKIVATGVFVYQITEKVFDFGYSHLPEWVQQIGLSNESED